LLMASDFWNQLIKWRRSYGWSQVHELVIRVGYQTGK